jgi:quercetin dioxygenase-like cupin family protein/DNA-binding Xre family transcriptional regulator
MGQLCVTFRSTGDSGHPSGPMLGPVEVTPAGAHDDAPSGHLEDVIALRVREFRLAKGISLAELARLTGMSKAMLSKIENAQTSCSLSSLARLADALAVPVTALFRGLDAEREAVFTPAGHGAQIVRRGSNVGHLYQLLGSLRGEHKRLEPLLVTLTEASEVFPLFQHPGTEFLYVLEGVMVYGHGEARYEMHAGDSLVFDGEGPHGPAELVELPVRFLTVTAYPH